MCGKLALKKVYSQILTNWNACPRVVLENSMVLVVNSRLWGDNFGFKGNW